jgi:hypothetical protein
MLGVPALPLMLESLRHEFVVKSATLMHSTVVRPAIPSSILDAVAQIAPPALKRNPLGQPANFGTVHQKPA